MIKIENVTYRYPDTIESAIKNLSLKVDSGEALCIMGSNGSGKSTLARLLAGLVRIKYGRMTFDDIDMTSDSPSRKVGILFQNPDNQMVAVMVEKEIAFALENMACPQNEMETIITGALASFGISHLRKRLTSELSGGEKQLVALASVMVQNPPVLVLDEPDSYLDESGKKMLTKQLARLRNDNPDLVEIRITQYPQIARQYPRLVVLDKGKIVADDIPSKIFANLQLSLATGLRYDKNKQTSVMADVPLFRNNLVPNEKPDQMVLKHISFSYQQFTILKDFNLSLRRGDIVGVIGPTGAGKSTLGLLCCGLLKPGKGNLDFYRKDILISQQVKPGWVSGVFQQPERQFFLSHCEEEITFGPGNFGYELTPGEVEGFFKMVGLEPKKFSSRDPFSLSVGEKRRLAFAAVLSTFAPFIVFDEPTSALDREGVGRFIIMAKELKDRGVGLMIISHDGDIIKELTDRVVYLKGDTTYKILPTVELFQQEWHSDIISSSAFNND